MKLTRRQIIAASASAAAYTGLGLSMAARAGEAISSSSGLLISKPIPRSGEMLPVIGLGTNRWVAAGNKSAINDLRATLRAFTEMGGRVIDTAPSYRSSEKALGQLIAELGMRDAFFLATKVDRNKKEEGLTRMLDSLDKLGTSSVDLMQIHNLRGAEAQIETLRSWQQEGRIRYIGITTSSTSQFADMELLMKTMPVDFVQLNYSLKDRAAEERLLPIALEMGIAVMVNRPFSHGRLFETFKKADLPEWATDIDCSSWAQFFLKYVVSHPAVTCTIPGTTKEIHVRDNMGANYGRLPDKTMRRQQEALFASL
jgi:aryl-alcohol dehydrogenase-like predicted oxidoreductase